jgi:hypothetical protein
LIFTLQEDSSVHFNLQMESCQMVTAVFPSSRAYFLVSACHVDLKIELIPYCEGFLAMPALTVYVYVVCCMLYVIRTLYSSELLIHENNGTVAMQSVLLVII